MISQAQIQDEKQPATLGSGRARLKPTQARAVKTYEQIVAAATTLLNEKGWEGFNTNAVAAAAEADEAHADGLVGVGCACGGDRRQCEAGSGDERSAGVFHGW